VALHPQTPSPMVAAAAYQYQIKEIASSGIAPRPKLRCAKSYAATVESGVFNVILAMSASVRYSLNR
jgi:hypothetical protein